MEMRIEVLITDGASDGKAGKQKYRARVNLPESGPKLIDEVERGILKLLATVPWEEMLHDTPEHGAATPARRLRKPQGVSQSASSPHRVRSQRPCAVAVVRSGGMSVRQPSGSQADALRTTSPIIGCAGE